MDELLPIREAARRAGVPEEDLRRAIVMDELDAVPVPDDRQYLIRQADLIPFAVLKSKHPSRRKTGNRAPSSSRWIVATVLASGAIVLLLSSCSTYSMNYVCTSCASIRRATEIGSMTNRFTVTSSVERTELTAFLGCADVASCAHRWIFMSGSGGGAI